MESRSGLQSEGLPPLKRAFGGGTIELTRYRRREVMSKRIMVALVAVLSLAVVGGAIASPRAVRPVSLALSGHITGLDTSGVDPIVQIAGTWTGSGAISDHGTYTESTSLDPGVLSGANGLCHVEKTFVGANGTFTLHAEALVVWTGPTTATFEGGAWWVDNGTGAYSHLRAGGFPAAAPGAVVDLGSRTITLVHDGWAVTRRS
jgi:hypothetical protein